MSNVPENSFITPDHNLQINYTYDTLWIHAKLKKGKLLAIMYLISAIITFLIGLFVLFVSSNDVQKIFFSFTYDRIALGILSLILCYLICLGLFKLYFRSYRNKRLGFFDQKIYSFNELLVLSALVSPLVSTFSLSIPLEFYALLLFPFTCWNFIGYTTYKMRTVEITVHKNSDLLQIEGFNILPLSFLKLPFLTVKHKIFSINPQEIFLAILHRDKRSVQKGLVVKGRRLLQYQYLSIEEARNKAEEGNLFLLSVTDKKFTLGSNSGAYIGSNFSIELIEKILKFLNTFTPSSVIKLENKTEADFTQYAVQHPLGPSKRTRTILLIFVSIIIIPTYIVALAISALVIYLAFTLPELNQKLLMLVLSIFCVIILFVPFMIYRSIRKAQDKEHALLDKYDAVQK